jgi:hypothetical protein
MEMREAREVAASLARARPRLVYYPHRYAAWLLGRRAGRGTPVRDLRRSRHARLLDNGLVRGIAARAGDGVLTQQALEHAEPMRAEVYRIGLTTWGPARGSDWSPGWYQTSRPGANIVLLLDFPLRHNALYRRLLDPEARLPMVDRMHPHARLPDLTLAWARIDIDLAAGEALIEEIQSDWIREFRWLWEAASKLESEADRDRVVQEWWRGPATFAALERYWTRVLAHHRAWWPEATLFAALWLLFEQLRIRRIYFHTPEGGVQRKRIRGSAPPRSLYTQLPRRFGFEVTPQGPALFRTTQSCKPIARCDAEDLPWYRLDL